MINFVKKVVKKIIDPSGFKYSGERQVKKNLNEIRADHVAPTDLLRIMLRNLQMFWILHAE